LFITSGLCIIWGYSKVIADKNCVVDKNIVLHKTLDQKNKITFVLSALHDRYCKNNNCYVLGVHVNPYNETLNVYSGYMTFKPTHFKDSISVDISSLDKKYCERANCTILPLSSKDYIWLETRLAKSQEWNTITVSELVEKQSFNLILENLMDNKIIGYKAIAIKDPIENKIVWITAIAYHGTTFAESNCNNKCKNDFERDLILFNDLISKDLTSLIVN
jgi:hypothetical protein